jgi:5-methylcytosine-specific restriction endonuclease McrA
VCTGVTAHRRPTIAFRDAPRGTCRWCGEAIRYAAGPKRGEPDRRRRWHPACARAYLESDPREARRRVRRRDRGVCAACGTDTLALRRRIRGPGSTRKLRELGYRPRKSLWELDHVVPLIEGGGHELSNLQTLCTPCHKRKTAQEATARRAARTEREEEDVLRAAEAALARSREVVAQLQGGSALTSRPPGPRSADGAS